VAKVTRLLRSRDKSDRNIVTKVARPLRGSDRSVKMVKVTSGRGRN